MSEARIPIQTRFSPDLIELIDEMAAESGVTRSELIRDAVERKLTRKCSHCGGTGREPRG